MSRRLLLAAMVLVANVAHAQRPDIDSGRAPEASPQVPATQAAPRVKVGLTGITRPFSVSTGQLIVGEISPEDYVAGSSWSADVLTLRARAGEVVTGQLMSQIPGIELHVHSAKSHTGRALVEGPATAAPLRFVAPKDGDYIIFVHAKGPQRFGEYLLSIGSSQSAPSFEPPKPPPVADQSNTRPTLALAQPALKPAPLATLPKLTPPPGVLAAEVGRTIARPTTAAGPTTEVFAFIGESGVNLQVAANGAGGYALMLYTPEGAPMLSRSSLGAATMTAILPRDGVYLLAVARQDGAKPYRLALTATPPSVFEWIDRDGAGYQVLDANGAITVTSCWVTPGQTIRYTRADGSISTTTTRRDGAGQFGFPEGDVWRFTSQLQGRKVVRTFIGGFAHGSTQTWDLDAAPKILGAYKGYLCP